MRAVKCLGTTGLAILMILLWPACEKDTPTPIRPDPYKADLPTEEVSDLLGFRLEVTSLTCLEEHDGSGDTEDLYGYLEAWVDYDDPGYQTTVQGYETYGQALMWYVRETKFLSLAENESVEIGARVDFVVNRNAAHQLRIHLKGHVQERDDNSQDEDLGIVHNEYEWGDITSGVPFDLVFDKLHDGHWSRVKFECVITEFNPRPRGVYPAGYGPADNFQEKSLYPELPGTNSYEAGPPAISDRLIVGQKYIAKFRPGFLQLTATDEEQYYAYRLRELMNKVNLVQAAGLINPSPQVIPHYNAVKHEWYGLADRIVEDAQSGTEEFKAVQSTKQLYPLSSAPRLQYTRFWKPIEVWRLPAGASLSKTKSFTNTGEESGFSEFSATVGVGLGAFSAEVSTSFGSSWTHGWETTEEVNMTYAAPEDKNVLYVVWQLWEEYRIIDANGDLFIDPNYEFRSMEMLTVPTDHIIPKSYLFDAY